MGIKDYFEFFTSLNGGDKIDYIVAFKVPRPNVNDYPNLLKVGSWRTYGESGYRLLCSLSKEAFLDLISEETKISKENIEIIRPGEFVHIRV